MSTLSHYSASRPRQRGSALFIALIALVSMTLAGIALVRSVDTSNLIAGNFAFRQSTLHTTDAGIETGVNALEAIVAASTQDTNSPAGCTLAAGNCNYYATKLDIPANNCPLANGVPSCIVWGAGGVPATVVNTSYQVQYVIDRLCSAALGTPPDPVKISTNCYADPVNWGQPGDIVINPPVYYRVTVRVTGPRNTVSLVQGIFSRG